MSNARLQLPSSFRRCRPAGRYPAPAVRVPSAPRAFSTRAMARSDWAPSCPHEIIGSTLAIPSREWDGCEAAKISWCSERNRCGDEVGLAQSDRLVTTITRPALSLRISTVIVRNIAKCCGQALHEQVRRFATEKTDHRRRRLLRFRRHRLRRPRAAQGGMNWWRKSFDHLAGVHQEAFRGY
jgi:hypothetical protein